MKLPQLHLRDLFWLVALVAMGCGWWMDRQRIDELSGKLAKEGASLRFVTDAMSHHLTQVEGRNVEWSMDEVTIDGKLYSRSGWIDLVDLEKAGPVAVPPGATRKKLKP